MNPHDPRLKLITAGLDGELPLQARRRLKRLLRSDAEALSVFVALRNDKRLLAGYSNPVLPVDFSRTVGSALTQARPRQVEISRSQTAPVSSKGLAWNKALALSLIWLAGLAFLGFWLVSVRKPSVESHNRSASVSQNQANPEAGPGLTPDLETPEFPRAVANAIPSDSWSEWLMPQSDGRVALRPTVETEAPPGKTSSAVEGNQPFPVLGAPSIRRNNLEELSLLLPTSLGWNDLHAVPQTMTSVLGGSGPVQIDLPSSDPNRAIDLLLGVLKDSRRGVLVDALAMDRVKRGNIRAHFMVLVEDINAVQLGSMLELLKKANDKQGFGKSGQFGPSMIVSSPDAMRKNLKAMVGQDLLDESLVRTSRLTVPRDLEGETTLQALQAVEGGRPPRTANPTASLVQPTVLVLAYSPYYPAVKSQPQSIEVRKYLATRSPGKPGAGRALLVFRGWSQ